MNFRATAVLFGALFVLALVLLGFALWEDEIQPSGELLMTGVVGAKAEDIDTVELERGDGDRLVLKRAGKDKWTIAGPAEGRADAPAVDRVIEALLKLRPTTFGEISSNPAVHGLDKPSLRVTLREGDKAAQLNVGEVTIGGTKAVGFVTTPDRKRPMAVPRADLDPLFKDSARTAGAAGDLAKWTNDYRAKQVFAVDSRGGGDDVTAIKLTAKGKELALSKAAGGWTFDAPAGWGEAALNGDASSPNPTAITGVRTLLNTVVNLQAGGPDDFLPEPKDLKEYGLNPDNPDLVRVELKPKDGPAEVAYVGKKVDAPATPPTPGSPSPPAGKVYVRVEGTSGVLRVTAGPNVDGLATLAADPNPLRDRDLLKEDVRTRVDAVDLTAGGQTVKLRKPTGATEWKLYGGAGDPQTTNQIAVTGLLNLLGQPRVVKDFPAPNDADFAGAELRAEVKLWTDGLEAAAEAKDEPKPKGTPTILLFGKKDAAGIHVRRVLPTGTKTDFILPEKVKVGAATDLTDVPTAVAKSRLDFIDPTLKGFSSFQATKFTVTQGAAVTLEVTVDKPGGTWKYVKPDAMKDRTADGGTVSDLLNLLATQTVGRFVAEQPAEADLAKWGLDPKAPRLKVEVGLDAGPALAAGATPPAAEKRTYTFGTETDDKQSVYARIEGRAAVFTVPKLVYEKFATADLRDRTVVRVDKMKVKKVQLKGWQKSAGFVAELTFERKGSDWVVKTPEGYKLDPTKVDQFLDVLAGLRAKAFVAGPPKPEYGLGLDAGGLQVVLEVDGGPETRLVIGGPADGGASFYGETNALPAGENLFTVPADSLKPFTEKTAAFSK